MKDTLLVTGSLGFIGTNLVRALNALGYDELLLVDHLGTNEKWRNIRTLCFEDYLDRAAFLPLIKEDRLADKIKAVFHLGACSSTTETDSAFLMENNYRYTKYLASWAVKHGIPMITASSAATYGDGSLGYDDDDAATPNYLPLNMYGMSKHLFDKWALKNGLYKTPGFVGLKFFNVYGPYEDHKGDMRSVVWKSYHKIKELGYTELFKSYRPEYRDGEQVRDFIYVDDVVRVMLYFFEHRQLCGLYNCGTGTPRSWNDLARAVFAALKLKPDIRYIDMPEHLQGKYQYHTCAKTDKLRKAGFAEPFTSLEDGVRDYVCNYLEKQC